MTLPEGVLAGDVSHCSRHDDLLSMGRRADARSDDDVHPDVAFVSELGLARVDADPKAVRRLVRPRLGGERALDLAPRLRSRHGPAESKKDPVSRPVDLGSAVGTRGLAHELAHACTSGRETLSQ